MNLVYQNPNGTPVNLTGYTAFMQVRPAAGDTNILVNISTTSGIVLGGTLGTIAITIPAATMNFSPGSYVYDLYINSASGVVTKLIYGSFTVTAGVTNPA